MNERDKKVVSIGTARAECHPRRILEDALEHLPDDAAGVFVVVACEDDTQVRTWGTLSRFALLWALERVKARVLEVYPED